MYTFAFAGNVTVRNPTPGGSSEAFTCSICAPAFVAVAAPVDRVTGVDGVAGVDVGDGFADAADAVARADGAVSVFPPSGDEGELEASASHTTATSVAVAADTATVPTMDRWVCKRPMNERGCVNSVAGFDGVPPIGDPGGGPN